MKAKMTRAEAIAIAQQARKTPEGLSAKRVHLWVSSEVETVLLAQSPAERGVTYALGREFEQDGHLLLYQLLDALGVRIISTIAGNPLAIVCRDKTYEGENHAALLLEILKDRLTIKNQPKGSGLNLRSIEEAMEDV